MNKKEAHGLVKKLLEDGNTKMETFRQLVGQGVSDSYIARIIASYADPELRQQHSFLINILLVITFLEIILAGLVGLGIGLKVSLTVGLIASAFMSAIMFLFFWGFKKNKVWAYNLTILLSITQFPSQLKGFSADPTGTSVAMAIGIALLTFTWYVRQKLFPDFAFLSPKKVDGAYVFRN